MQKYLPVDLVPIFMAVLSTFLIMVIALLRHQRSMAKLLREPSAETVASREDVRRLQLEVADLRERLRSVEGMREMAPQSLIPPATLETRLEAK